MRPTPLHVITPQQKASQPAAPAGDHHHRYYTCSAGCCLGMLALPGKSKGYVLACILSCQTHSILPYSAKRRCWSLSQCYCSFYLCFQRSSALQHEVSPAKKWAWCSFTTKALTVNYAMRVKASENINHHSVEWLTLINIAYAELWVGVYKGNSRLIITCPKCKIGGSETPSISLSWRKPTGTQSSLQITWARGLAEFAMLSSHGTKVPNGAHKKAGPASQTYKMLFLALVQWQTSPCTQVKSISLERSSSQNHSWEFCYKICFFVVCNVRNLTPQH